jgi:DNA-binding transcriptional LysR family regulator
MDKLELMKVFVRVCEVESFTGAADSLNMPKASVSLAIQRLEAHLETRLLQRTTRKVTVTQDGMTFYERCKDLLSDVDDVETMFQSAHQKITGRIRIDMPQNLAKNLIIPKLPLFLARYPEIEIELSSTDRRVDLIREGFDCVIRVGSLQDSGLIAKKIGEYKIINAASPAYLKKYGTPKKLEDLASHFQIHYVTNLGSRPDGFEYFDGEKFSTIKMKGLITVNNTDAYQAACLAGLGIIQVPQIGMREQLKDGTLIEILPKLKSEPMPLSIVYPHRRNMARRVRIFIDWAQEILKEYAS